jgi:hypothetical protein
MSISRKRSCKRSVKDFVLITDILKLEQYWLPGLRALPCLRALLMCVRCW